MAVEKMHLVNIMARLEDLDDFLEDLIDIDEFDQVDALRQIQNREFSIKASEENIDKTEDFNDIEAFEKKDPKFFKKLEEMKKHLDLNDSYGNKVIEPYKLRDLYSKLDENIRKKKRLSQRNEKLKEHINNLQALKNEDIDIRKVQSLTYFDYRLGEVSKDGRFILKNNYESIPSLVIHLQENDPDINTNKQALLDIYSIDEETCKLREDTDKILENERKNVDKLSLDLHEEHEKKMKADSSKIYDEIILKASDKTKEIKDFFKKQKEDTKKTFDEKKDSIINEFYEKIIK